MQDEGGSFGARLCYGFARKGGMDLYHRSLTAALAVREWDELRCVEEQ